MKNKRKKFINLLDDLCNIYKEYIKEHDNANLEIVVEDYMIDMRLYDNNQLVDQFGLTFKQKEREEYIYICICLMEIFFNRKVVYNKDNIFYKSMDCRELQIIVNDEDLLNKMFFYKSFSSIRADKNRRINNRINKADYVNSLDNRINISKKLVRSKIW